MGVTLIPVSKLCVSQYRDPGFHKVVSVEEKEEGPGAKLGVLGHLPTCSASDSESGGDLMQEPTLGSGSHFILQSSAVEA